MRNAPPHDRLPGRGPYASIRLDLGETDPSSADTDDDGVTRWLILSSVLGERVSSRMVGDLPFGQQHRTDPWSFSRIMRTSKSVYPLASKGVDAIQIFGVTRAYRGVGQEISTTVRDLPLTWDLRRLHAGGMEIQTAIKNAISGKNQE